MPRTNIQDISSKSELDYVVDKIREDIYGINPSWSLKDLEDITDVQFLHKQTSHYTRGMEYSIQFTVPNTPHNQHIIESHATHQKKESEMSFNLKHSTNICHGVLLQVICLAYILIE